MPIPKLAKTPSIPRAMTLEERQEFLRGMVEYRQEMRELERVRPKTRGDCQDGPRPCPFLSCKYNLSIDVDQETGSIKINTPGVEEGDLSCVTESCALDIADRGAVILEEVGAILNVTRERARQIEAKGIKKMHKNANGLSTYKGHARKYIVHRFTNL